MEKKLEIAFEGGKLILKVDMNQDGEASLKLEVDLAEILEEIGYIITKKDD